jgi:hypothetical protein
MSSNPKLTRKFPDKGDKCCGRSNFDCNYVFEGVGVESTNSQDLPNHYVPETIQTRQKYNLNECVSLNQGLERWKSWLKSD